jgi:hypothetical protein
MKNRVILLFFVVLLFSCERTQQEIIADTYTEWMGKQIKIPHNPIFTVDARDTVSVEYKNNYKIVVYVDSIGCIGCHLGLKSWERMSQKIDSLTGNAVPTMIFVNVTKLRDIEKILKQHDYHRPVCIDMKDEFNRLNKFSKYDMFRCFLLDEDDRVVLVGNPIQNAKVAELYIKTIRERFELGDTMIVGMDRRVLTLGQFDWRELQKVEYVLQNTSANVLHIDSITTSCECTKAIIDKEEIAIGDSAILSIEYQAERAEPFMREVYVHTKKQEMIISIEGEGIEM